MLAFAVSVGCGEDFGPYPSTGSAGRGGSGSGTGTAGRGGMGGTGGSAGSGATAGSGGSVIGGSTGNSGGDTGTGGTGSAGTGAAVGSGGSSVGAGGSVIGGSTGNSGGAAGSVTLQPWPSSDAVVSVDNTGQFGDNLSDLVYQPPASNIGDVLWGVRNDPSLLYCLLWDGTIWAPMTDAEWAAGKTLRYPGGSGSPDSEGLTRAELSSTAIYVSAERDNSGAASRLSILRYDYAMAGTSLTATHEWNLTPDLPAAPGNSGLEGLTWIPDAFLVANNFFDEAAGAAYNPDRYPDHGTGLLFVGLEYGGGIFGYALNHSDGSFRRIATIQSGMISVMSLSFDRDVGNLWTYCDNTCGNQASVLGISGGRFVLQHLYSRPATLPNSNFEGIAFAPESECLQGEKSFFWSDDSAIGGHAIYRGSIPCGPLP